MRIDDCNNESDVTNCTLEVSLFAASRVVTSKKLLLHLGGNIKKQVK